MRPALALLLLAGVAPAFVIGSSAFNAAGTGARTIEVNVVGDAVAYLTIAANPNSPHDCFVDILANESVDIRFDAVTSGCSSGTGAGIPAGSGATKYSRYTFHDILKVTNKGLKPVAVWANATTGSGGGSLVEAAENATEKTMRDADYAGQSASYMPLPVGASGFVGIRVNSGSLTTSDDVLGSVRLETRRYS